ncbi:hypothetical protein [Streptomyces sp. NPDC093094]|uniref:hypothetical protein n=1 Tax=Streptomyces sp. NPDC093094 TaxID=3366026 RepID=UPI00381E9351
MERRRPKPLHQLLSVLALAAPAAGAWAAWLGWDQERDVHPDGSTTGPYEAWQVIGLVVTVLVPFVWAVARRHLEAAVLGVSLGLAVSAFVDWSDDSSGLYVVGVGMVLLGSLAATTALAALLAAVLPAPPGTGLRAADSR